VEESWDQTTHFDLKKPLKDCLDEIAFEFDELRSLIGASLREYEERLQLASRGLPEWASGSDENIRKRFLCPALGPFSGVLLGPRAAATVAGKIEEEIRRWFDPSSHLEDPAPWVSLGTRISTLDASLFEAQEDVRRFVVDLGKKLSNDLEANLEALDDVHSSDMDALRSRESGPKIAESRETAAQSWEMQRRKAAELREAWAPIELLAFEGADWTVGGTRNLQIILRRAAQMLEALYPELTYDLPNLEFNSTPPVVHETWETEKLTPSRPPSKLTQQPGSKRPLIERSPTGATAQKSRPSRTDRSTEEKTKTRNRKGALEAQVSIETKIARTSIGWRAIGGMEMFLAVGLPLTWLAALVGWTSVRTLVPAAAALPSPAHEFGAATFALAALWLLAAPLFRGWKIGSTAGRRHVVRHVTEDVEAVLRLDEQGALWPEHKHRLENLSTSVQRWESESDGVFGWSLTLFNGHTACAAFFAPERNYTTWDQSDAPVVKLDRDAWQITPNALQQIQAALRTRDV
jgi:hypothetical protein